MGRDRAAAIDLGSNTFHLVIFEKKDEKIIEIYRKRHHVFLSRGGVGIIQEESMASAKKAIVDFKSTLREIPCDQVGIIGTAALRKASNGSELKEFIENELAHAVHIISGEREAELISKGVLWELSERANDGIIMDIGGGSVEFIFIKNGQVTWLKSFQLGVGILHSEYPHEEPIDSKTVEKIKHYILKNIEELLDYAAVNNTSHLIGCSGSFELIPAIKEGQYPPTQGFAQINIEDFHHIKNRLFSSDLQERKNINGLPPVRAELVVVAFILMDFIIEKLGITEISISKYAVKEGLISEMLA